MWNEFIQLSRKEQMGYWILILLLGGLLGVGLLPDKNSQELFDVCIKDTSSVKSSLPPNLIVRKSPRELFSFDPNRVDVTSMQKLGFSDKAIVNIIKYREKGGIFKKPTDILKLHGLDSCYKDLLVSCIEFEETESKALKHSFIRKEPTVKPHFVRKEQPFVVELNSADTTELKLLKGIGSVLANRIVRYRNKIGGFYSVDQINEVFGITTELRSHIGSYLAVDSSLVVPLNISKASLRQMKEFPYMDFYMAKEIYELRKSGNLSSVKQVLNLPAFKNADKVTLRRYLSL